VTLSLHVLAKNAASVIPRLLDNVGAYVDEIHVVLNDTSDRTDEILVLEAKKPLHRVAVTRTSHPDLYLLDEEATYLRGSSLAGEIFKGPFTGELLLAHWDRLRNLGWATTCDWRLFLDADDVVADPQHLPELVAMAEREGADVVATQYIVGRNEQGQPTDVVYRERFARGVPHIEWHGCVHESLKGGLRLLVVDDACRVIDLKDNVGAGVRPSGRNFKPLYHEARMRDWDVPPRHLAYLVQESIGAMPDDWVWGPLMSAYEEIADSKEERAWVRCMVGELWEKRGRLSDASKLFELALESYPSPRAAWRLSRIRFLMGDHRGCVSAYEKGKALGHMRQIYDVPSVQEPAALLLAAISWHSLSEVDKAKKAIDTVVAALPGNEDVERVWRRIHGKD
jgi:hypothetical protein